MQREVRYNPQRIRNFTPTSLDLAGINFASIDFENCIKRHTFADGKMSLICKTCGGSLPCHTLRETKARAP